MLTRLVYLSYFIYVISKEPNKHNKKKKKNFDGCEPLPYFEEGTDKMDSLYLSRCEKYTIANKWDPSIMVVYFGAWFTG